MSAPLSTSPSTPPSTPSTPLRNAMTVDLEDWYQVSAFERQVDRARWSEQAQRIEVGTERLLALFARHEVRATFFVLGWVAEHRADLVARVHDAGHEIASHGYEHRRVDTLDVASFRADLSRAKAAIRAACGVEVRGFRAPSFSMTADTDWAWEVLAEEGYLYSSSVFPVRHDRYGMPSFPRHPVRIAVGGDAGCERSLWEFPMTTWRVLGRNVPAAGGGWMRALPPFVMRRALRAANRAGHPGVVYVHPWELDPEQPEMPGVTRRTRFRHRVNLARTGERLAALMTRFEFGTMADVLARLEHVAAPNALAERM